MELSKRLHAVASLVTEGASVADIGTDHGYIPIYLIESGKCVHAFAMDVNQGPLLRAKEHIVEHGLEEQIETRLSDGVKHLKLDVFRHGGGQSLYIHLLCIQSHRLNEQLVARFI